MKQKIQEEEENLLHHQVHPGRCFGLEPESSDLEMECNGERKIIYAKDLFNGQKTLVLLPITTETNARTQMINVSVSATSTNQPKTSMTFVVIRTGFSADIHSTLYEMVPGSSFDLSNAEDIPSEEFITKKMNTDQYYQLGLALGLSYHTLDSIQFRSRQHEEAGVYTPNQKAAIIMIRHWKCLYHSVSLADDHLREVWKSMSDSGDSAPALKQRRRAGKNAPKETRGYTKFL
ncbi:uncharacterized protein LOC105447079 [Strongylocentrotus purpuratus]|uniref:Uncharacterized protein n=1 Tax=Strongylocentrotus purpuratus TaxID=7668 RepID=A0A7M7T3Q7_STRPU|nr:uncharacterized protein LOC105447079 [Strongylocentrotus purpuratus]